MPRYNSQVEIRNALGTEFWDALKLIDPEIAKLARGALADLEKLYDDALKSNAGSQEMVQKIILEYLGILKAELLRKDLTPEERTRRLDEARDACSNALLNDAENKRFISALFDKTLKAGLIVAGFGLLVFAAARSDFKPTLGA